MTLTETRHIDTYFRDFIARSTPGISEQLLNEITILSRATYENNSCIELPQEELLRNQIIEELQQLGLSGSDNSPITLHSNKMYLSRYFQYEHFIAKRLIQFNSHLPVVDCDAMSSIMNNLSSSADNINWQDIAILQALTRQLTIITGGPGTGKTVTIARITDLLETVADPSLRIELAAPTGKAAERLSQAIREHNKTQLDVKTIHRLLGISRDGSHFKYNQFYSLPCDVVIIDEASMIGLNLMYRILSALPDTCRLILVGDSDQLPSVEIGNVLADLCSQQIVYNKEFRDYVKNLSGVDLPVDETLNPLQNALCRLVTSHRFSHNHGIGSLANHIQVGNPTLPQTDSNISIYATSKLLNKGGNTILLDEFKNYLRYLKNGEKDPVILLQIFEKTRLLTPLREATLGVEDINKRVEKELERLGLKSASDNFYHGRPILITRNDYNKNLYNGDIGICVKGQDSEEVLVAFIERPGEIRLVPISRLPPHETCFAMTVHKSQGSEFENVTLILPIDSNENTRALLSRQLIYTAVTRAKAKVKLFCTAAIWRHCMENNRSRTSGLSDFFDNNYNWTVKS